MRPRRTTSSRRSTATSATVSRSGPKIAGAGLTSTSFCPKCGTPRVGGFRFCRLCQFDFDEISGAGLVVSAPRPQSSSSPTTPAQSQASGSPATPQSKSDPKRLPKSAMGEMWACPQCHSVNVAKSRRCYPCHQDRTATAADLAAVGARPAKPGSASLPVRRLRPQPGRTRGGRNR